MMKNSCILMPSHWYFIRVETLSRLKLKLTRKSARNQGHETTLSLINESVSKLIPIYNPNQC